jgi:hypothetical protein
MIFLTNACAECQAIPSETRNSETSSPVQVQQFGPLRERLRVSDAALLLALRRMPRQKSGNDPNCYRSSACKSRLAIVFVVTAHPERSSIALIPAFRHNVEIVVSHI